MKQPDLEGEMGGAGHWCVLVGPGPRMTGFSGLLAGGPGSVDVRELQDLAELLTAAHGIGRLLVDANDLDPEDVGILRRYLSVDSQRQVVLFGTDEDSDRFPRLADNDQAIWLPWPPSVETVRRLALRDVAPQPDEERPAAPALDDVEVAARDRRTPPSASVWQRESARLADLTQRLELSYTRLREETVVDSPASAGLHADLERLIAFSQRFGRDVEPHIERVEDDPQDDEDSERGAPDWTLVPPVSPGPPDLDPEDVVAVTADSEGGLFEMVPAGDFLTDEAPATFDLAALVEEKLAALSLRGSGSTRYELESPESVMVRAERSAISGALDTFLRLGRRSVGGSESLRARVSRRAAAQIPHVDVTLAWPAGPLGQITRLELLGPGWLEALFPDVSSADVRRAVERVETSGGRVDLRTDEQGFLRITIRTTLAPDDDPADDPADAPDAEPGDVGGGAARQAERPGSPRPSMEPRLPDDPSAAGPAAPSSWVPG